MSENENEVTRAGEIAKLLDLQTLVTKEYESGTLTSAQRVDCLKELRRLVEFRSLLCEFVVPKQDQDD